MSRSVATATALVQAWTRAYTAAVPSPHRATRRAELAADLHEHLLDLAHRNARDGRAAMEILRRLIGGVPADLAWALHPDWTEETMNDRSRTLAITGWITALGIAVLNLLGAIAGLQNGLREIGRHWWSTLAVAGVLIAVVGVGLTIAVTTAARRRS